MKKLQTRKKKTARSGKKYLSSLKIVTAAVTILTMVGLNIQSTVQPAQAAGTVTGRILAGGVPLTGPQAFVMIGQPMSPPLSSQSVNGDGTFSLGNVAPGTYELTIQVTDTSLAFSGTSMPNVVVTEGQTNALGDIALPPTTKTITGKVTRTSNNAGVSNVEIQAYRMDGGFQFTSTSTDANGNYTLRTVGGSWGMNLSAGRDQNGNPLPTDWVYIGQQAQVNFANDSSVESKTYNFSVENATATVTGIIKYPNGTAAQNLNFEMRNNSGGSIQGQTNSSGAFSTSVISGSYEMNAWLPPEQQVYTFPRQVFTMNENQVRDLGTIVLGTKNARIQGLVTCAGQPVANLFLNAWQHSSPNFSMTQTAANGTFSLPVSAGTWGIGIQESPNNTCVYSGAPRDFVVADNQTITGVNFNLVQSDVKINGEFVDTNGQPVTNFFGYAFARDAGGDLFHGPGKFFGAPVNQGKFTINLPSTGLSAVTVGAFPPPNADFSILRENTISIAPNGTYNTQLVLAPNDAVIQGTVKDNLGNPITNVFGEVFITDDKGTWLNSPIENGQYKISLLGGKEWGVGSYVDPRAGYLQEPPSNDKVLIGAGQTVTRNIVLTKTDAKISGKLLDPNGSPVPYGYAFAHEPFQEPKPGEKPEPPKGTGSEVRGGNFQLNVVGGTEYFVAAGLPPEFPGNYMPPEEQEVTVPAGGNATVTLQFREADGSISGTAKYEDGSPVQFGFVGAWSDKGSNSGAEIFGGKFTLNLTKDDVWFIRADTFTGTEHYNSGEIVIRTPNEKGFALTRDFTVRKSLFTFPEPISETFDASQPKVIALSDGSRITIPAGAIASSGNVTISIQPTVSLKPMKSFKPMGFGYRMTATDSNGTSITEFNSSVTISFPYNPEILAVLGLQPTDLIPSFYSTTTNTWTQVTTAVVNETTNVITFSINHFTDFALGSNAKANVNNPKKLLIIPGASGGPNIRIFDSSNAITAGFFAYAKGFRGGVNAISLDLDADGVDEIATIPASNGGPNLRIFDGSGTPLAGKMIAPTAFQSGWQIAGGDVDGDGTNEIVLGANGGGGPQIQVFGYQGNGKLVRESAFFAYNLAFREGVQLVVGDTDGDGSDDIVTAPNPGGGPHIMVYSKHGRAKANFFAYQKHITNGVQLSMADVNGDGSSDIITVPGVGSPANVATYSGTGQLLSSFFALPTSNTFGVIARAADVDSDGDMEIITVPRPGSGPQVSIFDWRGSVERRFFAYDQTLRSGLTAEAVDYDADGTVDIITAPGEGAGPHIGIFDYNGNAQARYFSHQENFSGGVTIGVGNQ